MASPCDRKGLPSVRKFATSFSMIAKQGFVRWDDLRLLAGVGLEGSLLGAGRELGLSTSTVSRRLASLERSVGRELLARRRDGAQLTDAGRALAEGARELGAAI